MNMESKLINNIMDSSPLTLTPDMPANIAVSKLAKAGQDGAPVVDQQGKLAGFFSTHDLLVELWCRHYLKGHTIQIQQLMRTELETVSPNDSILNLAECMCIDYGTLSLASKTMKSTTELVREQQVKRPRQYPVVKQGRLVGMVTRQHVVDALSGLFDNSVNSEMSVALADSA